MNAYDTGDKHAKNDARKSYSSLRPGTAAAAAASASADIVTMSSGSRLSMQLPSSSGAPSGGVNGQGAGAIVILSLVVPHIAATKKLKFTADMTIKQVIQQVRVAE